MALKMLRFSASRICVRSIMGCDYKGLTSTFIQSKRFQHSEGGINSIVELPGAKQGLGSLKSAVRKYEKMPVIEFKKLMEDDVVVDKFNERIKEMMDGIEIKPDNNIVVDDLTNMVMKAAQDVCGTSHKYIYRCNKCNDIFSNHLSLTNHQRICTGLLSDDLDKRKCDKCLKDIIKRGFPQHYIICQGIKANEIEYKLPRANCPDCGIELTKTYIIEHQKKLCKGRAGWKEKLFKECPKCGELYDNQGFNTHIKSCTGLKADDPNKVKCDKCLKEVLRTSFAKHHRNCPGIIETKSAKVNCPDCGKEMTKEHLAEHKRWYCRGELTSKDEILKKSNLLSDIVMKPVEDDFRIKDNLRHNITEEHIQGLRSRVTRAINVTVSLPDYNRTNKVLCPDCGLEIIKLKLFSIRKTGFNDVIKEIKLSYCFNLIQIEIKNLLNLNLLLA